MVAEQLREVTVRELRNQGGRVLNRVAAGETLKVTRDGVHLANLSPLPRRALSATELLHRARQAPAVDSARLRKDIDSVLDQSL